MLFVCLSWEHEIHEVHFVVALCVAVNYSQDISSIGITDIYSCEQVSSQIGTNKHVGQL